jgi:UDP-glucuronate 4-epimerase
MKILITGIAGFIGHHVAKKLVKDEHEVIGIDNINNYYDVNLKFDRLNELGINQSELDKLDVVKSDFFPKLKFIRVSLENNVKIASLFKEEQFDIVCHLAAQAGVRYSIENPHSYIESNIIGFLNILEGCRYNKVKHLVYASSSSVYGLNEKMPLSTRDSTNHPVSLYAATKKSNEMMAHSYSHLFDLPTTGLRFFTVYGPWGRPDMAPMLFAEAIKSGIPLKIFNNGKMLRDFTYIDDIVTGITKVLLTPAECNSNWDSNNPSASSSSAPFRLYNIGNSKPVKLMEFIQTLEKSMNKEAQKEFYPMQPGDVLKTFAETSDLLKDFNFSPSIPLKVGMDQFVKWYNSYYCDN